MADIQTSSLLNFNFSHSGQWRTFKENFGAPEIFFVDPPLTYTNRISGAFSPADQIVSLFNFLGCFGDFGKIYVRAPLEDGPLPLRVILDLFLLKETSEHNWTGVVGFSVNPCKNGMVLRLFSALYLAQKKITKIKSLSLDLFWSLILVTIDLLYYQKLNKK